MLIRVTIGGRIEVDTRPAKAPFNTTQSLHVCLQARGRYAPREVWDPCLLKGVEPYLVIGVGRDYLENWHQIQVSEADLSGFTIEEYREWSFQFRSATMEGTKNGVIRLVHDDSNWWYVVIEASPGAEPVWAVMPDFDSYSIFTGNTKPSPV